MTLYADVEYLKQAIDGLLAQCPEITDDEILREDMLVGTTEIEDVFGAILSSLREDDMTVAGIDKIAADLEVRKARAVKRHEAKRNLLAGLMERANLKKLTLPEATLSMSWRQPAPIVVDEAALPDDLVKIVRKPDMAAIRKWTETGEIPPGVNMSNGMNVLTIRVK
jgi:Siphovirus Gp157.